MKKEIWKFILQGKYAVSTLGRIKSYHGLQPRLLRPCVNRIGYELVTLRLHGITHSSRLVHHIVAETFLGPRPSGKQINHRDGVKRNNAPTNLEYVTAQQNSQHAVDTGLGNRGVDNGQSKLTEQDVVNIRRLYEHGNGAQLARAFGVSKSIVYAVVKRETWRHV